MTEKTRQYIIMGSVGLGAVTVLVVLAGKKSAASGAPPASAAQPANGVPPLVIPNYPAASFPAAPISIVSSPVFNAPGPRPQFTPTAAPPPKEGCACECDETPPPFTAAQVARAGRALSFSIAAVADNQRAQFPPAMYPQLYQH